MTLGFVVASAIGIEVVELKKFLIGIGLGLDLENWDWTWD